MYIVKNPDPTIKDLVARLEGFLVADLVKEFKDSLDPRWLVFRATILKNSNN